MKKVRYFLAPILLIIVLASSSYAGGEAKNTASMPEMIEQNLIAGLKSDNTGLQVSCAYFLGDLKSQRAIIPLMHLLRDGDCEGVRLIAALSLMKIGSERCIYMVKQEAFFNDCERVRRMCNIFYNAYLSEQNTVQESNDKEYIAKDAR
ncbi:MAG: hypothetical protein V1720_14470 [bacterium]